MSEHDPYDEFRFVRKYDSFEDPQLRSDYLDQIGKTRPYINALRLRLDAARKAEKAAAERATDPVFRGEPRRRRSRSTRPARVVGTRPPNRCDIRYAARRRRARALVLVIVIRLG
ncbi:hypothetical protein AB0C61_10195 [Streptomyces sp. NPDC048680]|uniref:hypothetical protein n=1 Tax=Streptomyces sp. NPDC048680 TaxID=3155492 RepID=UPI003420C452